MYAEFYKLKGRPFNLTPDPKFYVNTRTHRKAMAYLRFGIEQGEGFIIVTGDIGTGKTMLVSHLFERLDPAKFVCARIVTTQLDADNLLRMVAGSFGLDAEGIEKSAILQQVERFLAHQHELGKRVLLVIDEAQNLSIPAIEELRMLSNIEAGNKAPLQSFLLGQPEFKDKLALSPELEQLRQRVIATHHLEPMGVEEVEGYMMHRLKQVGWNGDPAFTPDAYQKIHAYSGGVPRRLNNLCSRILLYGSLEELHTIDAGVVANVIADLEIDSTPTTGPKHMPKAWVRSGIGPMQVMDSPDVRYPSEARGYNGHARFSSAPPPEMEYRINRLEEALGAHDRALRELLGYLRALTPHEESAPPHEEGSANE